MLEIYSLLDRKLREFGVHALPLAQNLEVVKRSLQDGIPGSETAMARHPEDFDLYLLGTFDEDTGMIVPEEVPKLVANLVSVLPPKEV